MIEYKVDISQRLLVCRTTGRTDFADFAPTLQRLIGDAAHLVGFKVLFVVEDVPAFLSCSDLRGLKPLVNALGARACTNRWAFVLPDKSTRVMAELTLGALNLSELAFGCFVSKPEAMEWLRTAAAPAGYHISVITEPQS